jgi:hypothetical protein
MQAVQVAQVAVAVTQRVHLAVAVALGQLVAITMLLQLLAVVLAVMV